VKLDKQADILIADPAKKRECPAGSISWKYIEDSTKNGVLGDIEEYRIAPATHSPRGVGTGQPTKRGRTPFTAEDDRVLTKWVMQAERRGLPTQGNEIYKQLEVKVGSRCALSMPIELMEHCRTTGIQLRHGVTVGSSISSTALDQTFLMMIPLHRVQLPLGLLLDLLLDRIGLFQRPLSGVNQPQNPRLQRREKQTNTSQNPRAG
jgi:hypothetical protein